MCMSCKCIYCTHLLSCVRASSPSQNPGSSGVKKRACNSINPKLRSTLFNPATAFNPEPSRHSRRPGAGPLAHPPAACLRTPLLPYSSVLGVSARHALCVPTSQLPRRHSIPHTPPCPHDALPRDAYTPSSPIAALRPSNRHTQPDLQIYPAQPEDARLPRAPARAQKARDEEPARQAGPWHAGTHTRLPRARARQL